ncbi:PEP/pyruvate-binding domain-containing protein [Candidatus Nanohalobium constans]|uniref:Pyruvate, water dikinase n=1 Tax=Candidatus Nanohalobium constans TaxID=2565781 RepID=A0A5Q0UH70_9ARCH|nr:PEP/pyruvate-binding domain-containing protein [Candidatus Nanohalobium constans]QGA81012.1 pyruvate, water dikinase [Candidatus Nanohalobium constans]
MVQWKGNLDRKQVGSKAAQLGSIQAFEVPNFFVLTKREVGKYLKNDPRQLLNSEVPEELSEEIYDAYDDIGMSSEVRKASGQARDLVGGQRENQRVSVRISDGDSQSKYRLNVGSSDLETALKEVLASYYQENDSTPAVIFQKMIEPDYTGAVVQNYTRRHSIVEVVEGLGHSLEEGGTVPEFYLLQNKSIIDTRVPRKQVKVTRNPMNGQRRTRTVSKNSQTFQDSEVRDLAKKAEREGVSLKFVYKRGTFYIVDAFQTDSLNVDPDLEALKVSEGEITGRQGEDYRLVDKPEDINIPQVARKGGFTSTKAQEARRKGIPAVFSLQSTDKINTENESQQEPGRRPRNNQNTEETSETVPGVSSVTAIEIRSIRDFPQLLENPFNIQDSEVEFAETCEEILAESPELVDSREISSEALVKALETVSDIRVLALDEASDSLLYSVVENGVEVLAVPEDEKEGFRKQVLRAEKKFMLDQIRD